MSAIGLIAWRLCYLDKSMIKINDGYHGFSNMTSNWVAAVLAANYEACLKFDDNYHRFYHRFVLVTQTLVWAYVFKSPFTS